MEESKDDTPIYRPKTLSVVCFFWQNSRVGESGRKVFIMITRVTRTWWFDSGPFRSESAWEGKERVRNWLSAKAQLKQYRSFCAEFCEDWHSFWGTKNKIIKFFLIQYIRFRVIKIYWLIILLPVPSNGESAPTFSTSPGFDILISVKWHTQIISQQVKFFNLCQRKVHRKQISKCLLGRWSKSWWQKGKGG